MPNSKNYLNCPAWLSWLECCPAYQRVVDSIPVRAHAQVGGLIPQLGCMQEESDWCFSLSLKKKKSIKKLPQLKTIIFIYYLSVSVGWEFRSGSAVWFWVEGLSWGCSQMVGGVGAILQAPSLRSPSQEASAAGGWNSGSFSACLDPCVVSQHCWWLQESQTLYYGGSALCVCRGRAKRKLYCLHSSLRSPPASLCPIGPNNYSWRVYWRASKRPWSRTRDCPCWDCERWYSE